MPSSAASRYVTEHRCPVSFMPRLCAFVDRRFQLVARDVHVRLERRRAHVGPVVDLPPRVGGVGELVHLQLSRVPALRGTARSHRSHGPALVAASMRRLRCSMLPKPFMFPPVRIDRHAAGEIQPREALGEIGRRRRPGRVVEMLVHHHEPRDHGLAGEVDDLGARRNL